MNGIVLVEANVEATVTFRTDDPTAPTDASYILILRASDSLGNVILPLSVIKSVGSFRVTYPEACSVDWRIHEDNVSYDPVLP